MRNYSESVGPVTRVTYGDHVTTAFGMSPGLDGHAAGLGTMSDGMFEKYISLIRHQRSLAAIRAEVAICEVAVESTIRRCWNDAKSADGGKPGAITKELFPDGVSPEIGAKGTGQGAQTTSLIERLGRATLSGAKAVAATWTAPLTEAHGKLADTLGRRTTAEKAEAALYADLDAAGREHRREVDRLMGVARTTFPQEPDRQNALFPRPVRRKKKAGGETI